MDYQKILNLLNHGNDPKFATRKWNMVNDNWNSNYAAVDEITYYTEILKSKLCDYNDAYILVTSDLTIVANPAIQLAFKNIAPFTKCIKKTSRTTIDDAEDLDLVMLMYNLIEYSSSYFGTTRSLWFYSKDKGTDFKADIVNDNNFKSFKHKAKLLGNTVAQVDNTTNRILKKMQQLVCHWSI